MESDPHASEVIINAKVMRMVRIVMHFTITPASADTYIQETIRFDTRLPVKAMMQGVFRAHHQKLFENIEKQ